MGGTETVGFALPICIQIKYVLHSEVVDGKAVDNIDTAEGPTELVVRYRYVLSAYIWKLALSFRLLSQWVTMLLSNKRV